MEKSKKEEYENIKKKYYQKKEDHAKFYKNILEFKNNNECSDKIKMDINNYLKLDGRKFYILTKENCCLIGLKNINYYDYIFGKLYRKYYQTETFGNTPLDFQDKNIRLKILNEQFMKVEPITINNYDYINKIRKAINVTSEVIILIVQPIDEGIFTKPFWKLYFVGERGVSGPFEYDQCE